MTEEKFNVIYENDDFLAVDKPANCSFHNKGEVIGVHRLLKKQLKADIWPVHRLDELTSGILLFAKNKSAAKQFGQQFEQREIFKTYIALSDKKPKKKQGMIVGDMQKSRSGNWKLCKTILNPAKTYFKSHSLVPKIRMFWVTPTTGKTHQIRVALKAIGAPILGDKRYSGSDADRGYLHACRLTFNWNGRQIDIRCEPTFGEYFLLNEFKVRYADYYSCSDSNSSRHPA